MCNIKFTCNWYSAPSVINIELTNICSKSCWMCGRRKLEKDYPDIANFTKHMPLELVYKILDQVPNGIIVQFHNSGDPLCYNYLKKALTYRKDIIRCFNTNGKLLIEKANEIIDNMETLTISVIENDSEGDKQYEIVKEFLKIKGDRKPFMIYRLLGDVGKLDSLKAHKELEQYSSFTKLADVLVQRQEKIDRWYKLSGIIATRILHSPEGSFNYTKKVTIPETGICQDLLLHIVINVEGKVSICVRFDPKGYGIIGDINKETLFDIWNSEKRKYYIQEHLKGNRNCNELCKICHFYGIPKG